MAAKLKTEAASSGRSFKDTVNETLRRGLNDSRAVADPDRFQVAARDLGLRPGHDLDNIGELLDQIDGASH